MTTNDNTPRLRAENGVLFVEGIASTRAVRLFLEGILGGERLGEGWRLEPRSRTLDELCIQVNRWLVSHGHSPQLVGIVDESVERDAERQRSFQRARETAEQFRSGKSTFSRADFFELLAEAGTSRPGNFENTRYKARCTP